MSSVGQVVGGIVGGVIGFFAGGNVMLGASIGMAVGGYIDPPKGPTVIGPRLEDLTVQTSTYGAVLPRIKGTIAVTGNVFWLEGDQYTEHKNTQKTGGKGGSTSTSTTFSYSATFAVGLAHCPTAPIVGVRRLWLANRLVYDAGSGDVASVIASNAIEGLLFKVYCGTDPQEPDPRMQADKGSANVSGYPGRAYIVFYDLDLTEHYSNALMATQVKVELVESGTPTNVLSTAHTLNGLYSNLRTVHCATVGAASVDYGYGLYDHDTAGFIGVGFRRGEYAIVDTSLSEHATSGITHVTHRLTTVDCDVPVIVSLEPLAAYTPCYVKLRWFYSNGGVVESPSMWSTTFPFELYTVATRENDTYFAFDGGSQPIRRFSGVNPGAQTAASYAVVFMGVSDNYLFALENSYVSIATQTVYQFDRVTLALVATHTQTANGKHAKLKVVSDDIFYTLTETGRVYKWISGAIVADLGVVLEATTQTPDVWFNVFSESPFSGAILVGDDGVVPAACYVKLAHQTIVDAPASLHAIITDECALSGIAAADLDLGELTDHDVRGYKIATLGSARSALEPLQAAFPFDVIQSGYKIKFKDRGSASVATIPEMDLGAREAGNSQVPQLPDTLEMPSQIPAMVTIQYYNAEREYDIDEQSAANRSGAGLQTRTINLPIVFTANEAVRVADVLLKKEWAERRAFGPFTLPPTWRHLEAGDVVTVSYKGRDIGMRLVRVTALPNGVSEFEGRLTSSAAYASTAVAQEALVLGQSTVALKGSSHVELLDIPRLDAAQNAPGIAAGLYGYTSAWNGGTLFRSDNGGETYDAISGFTKRVEVFTADSALGAGRCDIVDTASALTVTPVWQGADLFSISSAQLFAGGNTAAFGADGRWEILCFKTVVDNTGSYTLRDFLRGRFGTEWATGLHQVGDQLVMLDNSICQFMALPLSTINSQRLWRAVTSGATLDSAEDVAQTYGGVNLKPLSSVNLNGSRDPVTSDWQIEFTPRTRTPVELFSGVSQPVGETVESYEVDIYDSTFTAFKRTISGLSSPVAIWTNAQQVTDFGAITGNVGVKAYKLSPDIGRGYPLVGTLVREILDNTVTFLLHCTGVPGGTVFTEQKGAVITPHGNVNTSAAQYKYNTTSTYFDGSGDWLSSPMSAAWDLGTADACIEFWYFPVYAAPSDRLIQTRDGDVYAGISIQHNTATQIKLYVSTNGSSFIGSGLAVNITQNVWQHIAFVINAGVAKAYLNGVDTGVDYTIGGSVYYNSGDTLVIGGQSSGRTINGYLYDIRITNGAPRYLTNFTVPSVEFENP